MTTYPAVVGAFLAASRKEKGLSQSDLAEAVGLTVSTWSRIESGESALTIEQLAQAAQTLNLEPSALLRAVEDKIAELSSKGITTNATRTDIATIAASGAIPLMGAGLGGMIGTPQILPALAAVGVAGYSLYTKLKKDKKL